MPCPDVFVQDVPEFIRRKKLTFTDYLDERQPAILDAEHCVRLNYEAFFFGDLWTRERFASDPWRYCGYLTDPVSRERFRPSEGSPRTRHEQVTYYFQSEDNREIFKEDPEVYRLPGWKM